LGKECRGLMQSDRSHDLVCHQVEFSLRPISATPLMSGEKIYPPASSDWTGARG
jgi:hypothetical protein